MRQEVGLSTGVTGILQTEEFVGETDVSRREWWMDKEAGTRYRELKSIAVWWRSGGAVSMFRIYLENKGRKKWAGTAQQRCCSCNEEGNNRRRADERCTDSRAFASQLKYKEGVG
jgi:hypothetical protein